MSDHLSKRKKLIKRRGPSLYEPSVHGKKGKKQKKQKKEAKHG